jgi:hypothetical protein
MHQGFTLGAKGLGVSIQQPKQEGDASISMSNFEYERDCNWCFVFAVFCF